MYARECCASAWYAKAGLRWRRRDTAGTGDALAEVLRRVPRYPMAHGAMALLTGRAGAGLVDSLASAGAGSATMSVDEAMARALVLDGCGASDQAAALVTSALVAAPPGSAGWTLTVDPFLAVYRRPETWRTAVATVRERTNVWV